MGDRRMAPDDWGRISWEHQGDRAEAEDGEQIVPEAGRGAGPVDAERGHELGPPLYRRETDGTLVGGVIADLPVVGLGLCLDDGKQLPELGAREARGLALVVGEEVELKAHRRSPASA